MLLSPVAASWLLALLSLQPALVAAQDGGAWYRAHAGMARVTKVNQATHQLVDEFGRTRFFHGTNVVMKEPPWYRPFEWVPGVSSFGDRDVQMMHDLGINIVRLGHSWAGAEPVRGQYNQTFLDIMKRQTKLAEDQGIYVLVDVHQDLLARQFCGHGVPDWFVKKSWAPKVLGISQGFPFPVGAPYTTDSDGMPSPPSQCDALFKLGFSFGYPTVAMGNAFGRLYNNYDKLGDAFAAYWKKLASGYSRTTNVVGYDLLNEPWVGDSWKNPTLLVPGVGDRKAMQALWDRANAQIRSVDNDTLVWFEGATLDILAGFERVPGGDGSKTVQSFHYYRPPQLGPISTTLANRRRDSERLKTAAVLTELTFWTGDAAQMQAISEAMTATDAHMASWIGWAYENLYNGSSGVPYPALARHYSRAYPAAVAGTPSSFGFDEGSGVLKLQFTSDPTIDAPTEIMVPKSTFPNGYTVQVSPEGSLVQYLPNDRTLALFTSSSIKTATGISVTVTRK